ncbi:MAG TPA: hypothetical protein VF421_02660 [Niabella sp.]
MKRKEFFKKDSLAFLGTALFKGPVATMPVKAAKTNTRFDSLRQYQYTNEWVLKKQGAKGLLEYYTNLSDDGLYNPRHLPFKRYAQIQEQHTSAGWRAMDHSGDYGELAMFGSGRELLPPFIKNNELHNLLLKAAGVLKS